MKLLSSVSTLASTKMKMAIPARRAGRVSLAAGLSIGLLSLSALAAPPVFDRVPDNAMLVIGIPSPETLGKNLKALGTATEFPAVPDVKDLVQGMGFGSSLDLTKALAVVVMAPEKGADGKPKAGKELEKDMEKRVAMLVPVSNYAEFITGLGGKAGAAGGVDSVTQPSGESGFSKDIGGGYAVLGQDKAIIEAFTGKSGDRPVKGKLGKAADKISDSADFFTFINTEEIRPFLPEVIAQMKEEAKNNMAMANPEDVEKQMAFVQWMMEMAVNDSQGLLGSANFSGQGVGFEMTANLKPESMLGKAFAAGGSAGSLWTKLPAQAYLLAGSIDTSSAPLKALFRQIIEKAPSSTGGGQTKQGMLDQIDNAEGYAAVMGFPQGGLMAGLMTSTVSYVKSKNPDALLTAIQKTVKDADGKSEQGMTISATYTAAGAKAGETSVDVWETKMTPAKEGGGEGAAMLPQAFQMLFGNTTGPAGLLAKTDGGIYQTFSKSNTEIMQKALAASKGQGELFGADKLIGQVAEKLPGGRVAEAFIGTKTILDMITPFAAMTGMNIPADKIPAGLPPLGLSIAGDQGSARMSVFVPAPVIKTGVGIGQSVQEQMGGMEEDGDAAPAGDKKTGQPRF